MTDRAPLAEFTEFAIPQLLVGTLDTLIVRARGSPLRAHAVRPADRGRPDLAARSQSMSDELAKIDHSTHQTAIKIERAFADLEGVGARLTVNDREPREISASGIALARSRGRSPSLSGQLRPPLSVGHGEVPAPPPASGAVGPVVRGTRCASAPACTAPV